MKITFEDTRSFGTPDPPETFEVCSLRFALGDLLAKGIPEDEEYFLAHFRSPPSLWITMNNHTYNSLKVEE